MAVCFIEFEEILHYKAVSRANSRRATPALQTGMAR